MYDIKQFKPALYILVMLGITGFALAARSPGMWLLGAAAVGLNAWLVFTRRFTPMPRILANIITVLSLLYVLTQVMQARDTPILTIGQFLVLLQIIKLFEQRANRDYAQLLVLSLLLMVAAAISTASLLFGVMLVGYLFLSLYCCLLFHLKVETDDAKKAMAIDDEKVNPSTLRQDQRYLPRSMRRLTGLVSGVALTMAVIVFVLFPRGTGAGLLGQLQFRPSQTLTGFSDQVSFQQVARITQNEEIVAYLTLQKNGESVKNGTLYLRGTSLDTYSADGVWQWTRTMRTGGRGDSLSRGDVMNFDAHRPMLAPEPRERYEMKVMLKPTGTNVLFSMPGPTSLQIDRTARIRFSPHDEVIESIDPLVSNIAYTLAATGELGGPEDESEAARIKGTHPPDIDPKVREFAQRPDVSGTSAEGESLAVRRGTGRRPTELDAQIAANMEKYLQRNFKYTLDLTDAQRIHGQDPLVWFLTDEKEGRRGHCEYFAGAMTLMCQSLGMKARMIVGFKVDGSSYNNFSDNFVVRQSHAHAWVEVLTPQGWKAFDPTTGNEAGGARAAAEGMWSNMRRFLDFLEYTWANNVVAYNQDSRDNVISQVEKTMTNTAIRGGGALGNLRNFFDIIPTRVLSNVLGVVIAAMILALFVAVGYFLYERWKLRRRAARIGIDAMSTADQLRLARQLGFYDELVRLLERHNISRAKHLTPKEFGDSLDFLPAEVYRSIQRLTQIYYRIRYGHSELEPAQQRRLSRVINQVGESLGGRAL